MFYFHTVNSKYKLMSVMMKLSGVLWDHCGQLLPMSDGTLKDREDLIWHRWKEQHAEKHIRLCEVL